MINPGALITSIRTASAALGGKVTGFFSGRVTAAIEYCKKKLPEVSFKAFIGKVLPDRKVERFSEDMHRNEEKRGESVAKKEEAAIVVEKNDRLLPDDKPGEGSLEEEMPVVVESENKDLLSDDEFDKEEIEAKKDVFNECRRLARERIEIEEVLRDLWIGAERPSTNKKAEVPGVVAKKIKELVKKEWSKDRFNNLLDTMDKDNETLSEYANACKKTFIEYGRLMAAEPTWGFLEKYIKGEIDKGVLERELSGQYEPFSFEDVRIKRIMDRL